MTKDVNPSGIDLFSGAYKVFLFDMDGVLTDTASTHSHAWKQTFDSFLQEQAAANGTPFVPFDINVDYPKYVDGKRREDGVRSFLESRDIHLPKGDPTDAPTAETIYGVGNRKNQLLLSLIEKEGVVVYEDALALLHKIRARGYKTAVVSSSANTTAVLTGVNMIDLFDEQIDGVVAAQLALPGKPAPDTFIEAARRLGASPDQAVIFEDAESGVAAGQAGNFGLTIGVDRVQHAEELYENGADVVFDNLAVLFTGQPG